jgi:low affinity Fe/Cu permease
VLAPTDPVVTSTVVTAERVPSLIRHTLNLESGLNDGLALPFVLILIALATPGAGAGSEALDQVAETAVGAVIGVALAVVAVWGLTGPLFGFSDTWQLVINTGTTIVTFLMVFLIQRAQNKDARAIHLKLNEIVAALQGASNRLINVEDLTEDEVRLLHRHYTRLVALARETGELTKSHSVEEAAARHELKLIRDEKRAS